MSSDEKWERYSQMEEEIWDKYNYVAWSDAVDRKTLTAKSAFFTEKAEMIERLKPRTPHQQNCAGATCAVYHSFFACYAPPTSP